MAIGSPQWMYSSGEYELEQSLKFNDDDSAYLSKTLASAGNQKTWTFSCWFKRGKDARGIFLSAHTSGSNTANITIQNSDIFQMYDYNGSYRLNLESNQVFRDHSAWYHILVVLDTTQATEANRAKVYINGSQITSWATAVYPSQNTDLKINSAMTHEIGRRSDVSDLLDGYLAEVNFIDGQAKAPADFGETGDYGEWKPIEYSGTYGTNGFYLPFKQDYTVEGFSTVTYTGTGISRYIGGVGFQPDLVWFKERNNVVSHRVFDSVRGATKRMFPNNTGAESTQTTALTSFDTDGFSLGTGGAVNGSSDTYVAWNWDMGGSNATNTNGSITSTVRANPTYGQSIVSYTGTGSNATIGHGLSSAPEMVMTKRRDSSGDWDVWHTGLGDGTKYMVVTTQPALTASNIWNSTVPSSTVVSLGTHSSNNASSGTYIAYCFHSVTGYSKFGSYTGNGSATGTVVTTGFAPAFVMIKVADRTDGGNGGWFMYDNTRSPYTAQNHALMAQSDAAELVDNSSVSIDFLSTGFQLKTSYDELNVNGGTYIYMAFADKREYAYWLDQSGNNNDWTSNNLTESDISVDSPTNNFATLNPLGETSDVTYSEGNLKFANGGSTVWDTVLSTMGISSGKWYFEIVQTGSTPDNDLIGFANIQDMNNNLDQHIGNISTGWGIYAGGTPVNIYNNGSSIGTITGSSTWTTNDVIMLALDMDNGEAWWGKNGTWWNSGVPASRTNPQVSSITGTIGVGGSCYQAGHNQVWNFGQDSSFAGNKTAQGNQDGNNIGDFYYTPPTGFLALCTKNLPDVAVVPSEHFNTVLYTGTDATNSTHAITGIGFQPDFVWTKDRDATYDHYLFDSVRGTGVTKGLSSSSSRVEGMANESYDALSSFDSDGFTITGAAFGSLYQDRNNANYVSWNWKAGNATLGTGDFTQGSSASTCSRNVDAGFSIVSYTGTGSTATVGHGLSKAPEMMIIRSREVLDNWLVFANTGSMDSTDGMYFDSTTAKLDSDTFFNDTAPTNSLFTVKSHSTCNTNTKPYIAYCFHSVDGYSKVGSYTGNGSTDGTFVYTGFRPAFIICKKTSDTSDWIINDTTRDTYNNTSKRLFTNTNDAESGTYDSMDILSNGFKMRNTNSINISGASYIFLAFAETPFKYSNAR